ncbi:MAG: TIM barrel protein [Deltaproteobacteria bacterium]|nr:TIM barrel protein [Deltaproteobacteria bacterium]
MRLSDHLHLSYCTNVHPGEGLGAAREAVEAHLPAVASRLRGPLAAAAAAGLGAGLRLGAAAADALARPEALRALRNTLEERGGYVFTVNGFPHGDFAAPRVKENAYEPDWATGERLRYTLTLARALAALPGPPTRTISTVAGGFEPSGYAALDPARAAALSAGLCEAARGLARLEGETGVSVRLALEPEPWTTLERTSDAVDFFTRWLWPAEPLTRRYLGLCYDACHQAIAFEDPEEAWRGLEAAGVEVLKVQLSNALAIRPPTPAARAALLSFSEPRYLHQVTARGSGGGLLRALDLPDLPAPAPEWLAAPEWRCHFHVPLWWEGAGEGVGTTAAHWRALAALVAARAARAAAGEGVWVPHVEVETYSWGVIPLREREGLDDVYGCVARELEVAAVALGGADFC